MSLETNQRHFFFQILLCLKICPTFFRLGGKYGSPISSFATIMRVNCNMMKGMSGCQLEAENDLQMAHEGNFPEVNPTFTGKHDLSFIFSFEWSNI
jgi:hypothetical protein